jgi:hypothetical protein
MIFVYILLGLSLVLSVIFTSGILFVMACKLFHIEFVFDVIDNWDYKRELRRKQNKENKEKSKEQPMPHKPKKTSKPRRYRKTGKYEKIPAIQ